ncbi:hypothetical protein [Mesorhizobium sp.]|uniref:hypothetical protein n=1 Tax=Mesorhizobium sp. TaxID=1871066 RepID=UPI000FE8A018|nr:hypothetical protein [Mesorhizobium sp.]RWN11464.1 MAG: hypothetical protein EOR87_13030 [Mesorhizobium sp.]RWN19748.1 MAG: hypothetical protein EOR88_11535 [Mesorhizobium sp.]
MSYVENGSGAPMIEPIGSAGKDNVSHRKSNRSRWHAQEKWAADHPLEVWAHYCLKVALKRGLIEREPCEVCGDPQTDGHHHEGYHQPMSVKWLCRLHHKAEHRRLKCEAVG